MLRKKYFPVKNREAKKISAVSVEEVNYTEEMTRETEHHKVNEIKRKPVVRLLKTLRVT